MKSTPCTAACVSSVSSRRAPLCAANSSQALTCCSLGQRARARRCVHPCPAGADQQQGVAHVVARIAQIGVADLVQRLVAVLAHGHDVGDHLRRMVFVGQAVVDRHAGVARQLLDDLPLETTVFDGVVQPSEHPRGVLHAFLVADLRGVGVDVGDVGALIVGGHLEGAAGSRGGLLEDQRDVLALEMLALGTAVLGALEVAERSSRYCSSRSLWCIRLEQAAAVNVEGHGVSPPQCRFAGVGPAR